MLPSTMVGLPTILDTSFPDPNDPPPLEKITAFLGPMWVQEVLDRIAGLFPGLKGAVARVLASIGFLYIYHPYLEEALDTWFNTPFSLDTHPSTLPSLIVMGKFLEVASELSEQAVQKLISDPVVSKILAVLGQSLAGGFFSFLLLQEQGTTDLGPLAPALAYVLSLIHSLASYKVTYDDGYICQVPLMPKRTRRRVERITTALLTILPIFALGSGLAESTQDPVFLATLVVSLFHLYRIYIRDPIVKFGKNITSA